MYPGSHRNIQKNIENYLQIGWYHFLLVIFQQVFTTSSLGNMGFMAFGGLKPKINCSEIEGSNQIKDDELCIAIKNGSCGEVTLDAEFYSIAMDWNLICDDTKIVFFITSIQMVGVGIGAPTFGQLSDLFGRKWVYIIAYSGMTFIGGFSCLSPNWLVFCVLRFFVGFFVGGEITVFYVYFSELIPSRHRVWLLTATGAPLSYTMFAWIAYYCQDWRTLSWFNNVYPLPFIVLFCLLTTESPRYCIQKKKLIQARESIVQINKWTCRSIDNEELRLAIKRDAEGGARVHQGKRHSFWHLFYSWKLVKYSVTLALAWFTTSCVSYGILFNSGQLAGSIYINVTLYGVIRWVIAIIMSLLDVFVNVVGRQVIHTFSAAVMAALTGVIFALTALGYGDSQESIIRVLNLGCAGLLSCLWSMIYLVAAELYPTPIRNLANSFCSIWARVGATVAPQVLYLSEFWSPATYLFFCSFLIVDSILFFLALPETKGLPMPEYMPEVTERIFYRPPKDKEEMRMRAPTVESGHIRSNSFSLYKFEPNADADDN